MQLNPKLLDVLASLGANEAEMASITEYYLSQFAAAQASVDQIKANIESLQKQLEEETARATRIIDGIGKFVVPDA